MSRLNRVIESVTYGSLLRIREKVSTLIVCAVAFAALAGGGSALAADVPTQSAPNQRALTKNQRIALSAIDAHQTALTRYATFLSGRPAAVEGITDRLTCVIERVLQGGLYYATFDALPSSTQMQVLLPVQWSYWYGHMYRLLPPKKGRFSARAIKGIYLDAIARARALNPDITGERIIRGLRAQVDRIDVYRSLPKVQACAVFDDWAANGYDLDRLDPLADAYSLIALKVEAANTSGRLTAAIAAMSSVPGINSGEANEFSQELVYDSFVAISQPLAP